MWQNIMMCANEMRKASRSWHNLIILQNARNSEIFLVPTSLGTASQTASTPQPVFLRENLLTSAGTRRFYTKKGEQNGTVAQYIWRKSHLGIRLLRNTRDRSFDTEHQLQAQSSTVDDQILRRFIHLVSLMTAY